jgi:hypothetical protein
MSMNCRTVINQRGEQYNLSETEERYLRALERLGKMDSGRLRLMANGTISIRINGNWHDNNIDGSHTATIYCDGGDGGD